MFQLAAGNDVKPASHLRKVLQDGKISVGLYGETDGVWNLAHPALELFVSIRKSRPAIHIPGRAKRFRRRNQIDALAKNALNALVARGFFPGELRRVLSRID